MNKEHEQGLFSQIEEVLQTHEESYELGAWEEFDANRKKKKRGSLIYVWLAAAVILLCLGFGLMEVVNQNNLINDTKVFNKFKKYKEETKPVSGNSQKIVGPHSSQNNVITNANINKDANAKLKKIPDAVSVPSPVYATAIEVDKSTVPVQQNLINENTVAIARAVEKDKPLIQKQDKFNAVTAGTYDSLANPSPKFAKIEKSQNKITYAVVVSPSLSNKKLNFGAGMELAYHIGDHFSVNSGLMYTALNAKSEGKSLNAANSTPQSASLAVSGVELPLGIQYRTSGGFYASAGVSALGLINDKLEYNFLQQNTITQSNSYATGASNDVLVVVSERKREESIEPLNNYMGFFNFSAGKKQAFGKTNLNIGPFLKVPFSSVSSEKIKLLQGGIKISVDF